MSATVPFNIDLKSPGNVTFTFNINLRITVDKSPENAASLRAVRSPAMTEWYNNKTGTERNTASVMEIKKLPAQFEDTMSKRDSSASSRRRSHRSRSHSSKPRRTSIATAKSGSTSRRRSSNIGSNSSSSGASGTSSGTSGTSARRSSSSVSTARTPGAVLKK